MTEQIKSAIETFKDYKENGYDIKPSNEELFDIAICSLSAWDEVLAELKSAKVNNIPCDSAEEAIGIGKGLTYAIDIINQHLSEIEGE